MLLLAECLRPGIAVPAYAKHLPPANVLNATVEQIEVSFHTQPNQTRSVPKSFEEGTGLYCMIGEHHGK